VLSLQINFIQGKIAYTCIRMRGISDSPLSTLTPAAENCGKGLPRKQTAFEINSSAMPVVDTWVQQPATS
jgi:hypothetical protein